MRLDETLRRRIVPDNLALRENDLCRCSRRRLSDGVVIERWSWKQTLTDYQDLIRDHDEIDQLAEAVEKLATGDRSGSVAIDALLSQLARIVEAHLAKEDSFIYPAIIASKDPADAASLVVEFEVIKRDWKSYLEMWRDGAAASDWPAFRIATIGMLSRLRERVMKETGLLYSIALREGTITLAPTTGQVFGPKV